MAKFEESKMTFEFPDMDFYYVEKSPLLAKLEGISTCECIVNLRGRITLIEAKSSSPSPKNDMDFHRFIREISQKFNDTLVFYNAVKLRQKDEHLPENLSNIDLSKASYEMFLIVHGHKIEWLPPLMDALKKDLKSVLRLWNISDVSVKVINEQIAKSKGLISDFE